MAGFAEMEERGRIAASRSICSETGDDGGSHPRGPGRRWEGSPPTVMGGCDEPLSVTIREIMNIVVSSIARQRAS